MKPRDNQIRSTRSIPTVENLVTDGLGYCCEFAFFHYYKKNSVIATRLGISARTIRIHRAKVEAGESTCKKCPGCLASLLPRLND